MLLAGGPNLILMRQPSPCNLPIFQKRWPGEFFREK
jgi:hypothetical protein